MSYSSEVLADSPVAYWRLNESSGTAVADSSGNSRGATLSGSYTRNVTGLLVGDSDTATGFASGTYADTGAFPNPTTITIEAIIKPTGSWPKEGMILNRDNGSGTRIFQFRREANGKLLLVWWTSTGGPFVLTSTGSVAIGSTAHVAATIDGTNGNIYINGALDSSLSGAGNLLSGGSFAARIGGFQDVIQNAWFIGTLDEVAVYSTALSSTRIAAHYTAATTSTSVTGTTSATLPALTASSDGTVAVPTSTGSVSAGLPSLTASAAGTFTSADRDGTVAATLPALTASVAGTHTSNDQAGTVAATLPALTGAVSGTVTDPAITGTLSATLPALTALVEDRTDTDGTVAGTLPALSASIVGTAGDPLPPVDETESPVDDEVDDDDPDLILPPEGFVERPIMRRSVIVPDLSGYPKDPITGQPHVTDAEYDAFEVIEEEVGVIHVTFPNIGDSNDVTYYRGLPLQGMRFLRREPFGDADADVTIPGITSMDIHPDDTGTLHSFTRARGNCEFWVWKSDGTKRRLWSGNVFTRTLGNDGRNPTMQLHCLGSLYMADSTRARPVVSDDPLDYGYLIPRAFNLVISRRYKNIPAVTTGILTNERGAWSDSPMGFVLDGLAKCWTVGGRQWTIAKVVGSRRQYEMRLKKTSPEWTFTNGARGVYVDIEEDDNGRNIVYGHGVNADGGVWFNTKYLDNGTVTRRPLAADPATQKYLYDEDGNIIGENPAYNVNVLPREDDVDFGQNPKSIGIRSAQQIVDRESVPSFVGRITVETDPREGWRGDIQAGDKMTLIGYQGRDLVLHISDVEVSLDGNLPVTLTVDERSRDAMTVAQIRDRNKEARRDPALRPGNPNRRSRLEQDQIIPFDSESPAGRIPAFFAEGGEWTVKSIPFATAGRIAKVHFDMGSPMAAGLFAFRPSVANLNSLIGNPLTQDDPLKAHMNTLEGTFGLCAFWGQKGQRMGYSPGREDDSDPFTGDFDEATGFDYVAQANARLYLAVYAAASTTVSGRCYPALVV